MAFSGITGRTRAALALAFALGIGGCATLPSDPGARAEFEATNDPLEPLNRRIFDFNLFVDRILIKPVARVYQAAIPEIGRDAIRHFLDNLTEPVVFANDLLQGEFHRADVTLGRFLFNSTFGLGGLMDLASSNGLEKQSGDFGQTLYRWGVPDGPYLVIPVFGPSNPRDAVGGAVQGYLGPYSYVFSGAAINEANWGRRVTGASMSAPGTSPLWTSCSGTASTSTPRSAASSASAGRANCGMASRRRRRISIRCNNSARGLSEGRRKRRVNRLGARPFASCRSRLWSGTRAETPDLRPWPRPDRGRHAVGRAGVRAGGYGA